MATLAAQFSTHGLLFARFHPHECVMSNVGRIPVIFGRCLSSQQPIREYNNLLNNWIKLYLSRSTTGTMSI